MLYASSLSPILGKSIIVSCPPPPHLNPARALLSSEDRENSQVLFQCLSQRNLVED
ncbi:hypothetical protein RND71_039793 [Anisodus tanguticus]|uniref:Uncharacterized protein n=1 Tax=Anisodus tanguticus TaxID=243964 RepID=A0AAE1QZT8_9SOLA|nr:hypothetical protein RND71_039793 [Anisodus tanguticus]